MVDMPAPAPPRPRACERHCVRTHTENIKNAFNVLIGNLSMAFRRREQSNATRMHTLWVGLLLLSICNVIEIYLRNLFVFSFPNFILIVCFSCSIISFFSCFILWMKVSFAALNDLALGFQPTNKKITPCELWMDIILIFRLRSCC